MCHSSFMTWLTNQKSPGRSPRALQTKPEFPAGHGFNTGYLSAWSKEQGAWAKVFYKGRAVKDTGGQFCSNCQRGNMSWFSYCKRSTRECSVWWPGKIRAYYIHCTQIYILEKSLARLNLPMLLMRGMMTKFRHINIFGEPNDYILGKFGKADVNNAQWFVRGGALDISVKSFLDQNDWNKGDLLCLLKEIVPLFISLLIWEICFTNKWNKRKSMKLWIQINDSQKRIGFW